ncbi:hypothetical protein CAPTEDRAFT_160470, partial [Capitella teleta]
MVCDCSPPSQEDISMGLAFCGEDCLNRMLMIECGSRCPCGDMCTNKRFQRRHYAKTEPFRAEVKGWGLRATSDLSSGVFVMEYVGEVLDYPNFRLRCKQYAEDNHTHHYFMALNGDEIIDATQKGNTSRFINHSCDPNCETQKWTVNGQLRVGFFTLRSIPAGTELTFDYQFEQYGSEIQRCFCGADSCRGIIGTVKEGHAKEVQEAEEEEEVDIAPKKSKKLFDDHMLKEEIEKLESNNGLRRKDHVLELARLMVRAESSQDRRSLLHILQVTKEAACLRL